MADGIVATIVAAVCLSIGFAVTRRLRYRPTDAVFAVAGATTMALTWWLAGIWHPVKNPVFILIALSQLATTFLLVGVLGHYRRLPGRSWWFGVLGTRRRKAHRDEQAA